MGCAQIPLGKVMCNVLYWSPNVRRAKILHNFLAIKLTVCGFVQW